MKVTKDVLNQLLSQAFDSGHHGSYELKTQEIEEIIWSFQKGNEIPFVMMTCKEIAALDKGVRIFHTLFGMGTVSQSNKRGGIGNAPGEKYVQFSGFRMELSEEGWPWNVAVQVIY